MITYIITALTAAVSILAFRNQELQDRLKFNAWHIKHEKQWYRFVSHTLVHGGIAHLAFNILVLLSFGGVVEQYYKAIWPSAGIWYYLVLYWGGAAISSAASYYKHQENPYYNAVGASGAISAIVFSSIIFDPLNKIYFMFIPIGIPAFIFGGLYLILSAYMSKKNVDNIGHDAHFWGAIFGFVFTIILKPQLFIRFIDLIINK